MENNVKYKSLSTFSKTKGREEVYNMTQSDLILRLVEIILAEKDKNNRQSKAEEQKKSKD